MAKAIVASLRGQLKIDGLSIFNKQEGSHQEEYLLQ